MDDNREIIYIDERMTSSFADRAKFNFKRCNIVCQRSDI